MTPDQLEKRRQSIGASEMPAVLNLSPFATPADIYAAKVYGVESSKGNTSTEMGNRLEPVLIDYAAETHGLHDVLRGGSFVDGILSCTLDAGSDDETGIEAKATSQAHEWDRNKSDGVPDHVMIQCQQQIAVAKLRRVLVPVAFVTGYAIEWQCFEILPEQSIIDHIRKAGRAFWDNHVVPRVPPPDSLPSMETLKALRRTPGKLAEPTEALRLALERREMVKGEISNRRDLLEMYEREALTLLGDCDGAVFPDGARLEYLEHSRKGYEVKPTTYRQLKFKPAKGE